METDRISFIPFWSITQEVRTRRGKDVWWDTATLAQFLPYSFTWLLTSATLTPLRQLLKFVSSCELAQRPFSSLTLISLYLIWSPDPERIRQNQSASWIARWRIQRAKRIQSWFQACLVPSDLQERSQSRWYNWQRPGITKTSPWQYRLSQKLSRALDNEDMYCQ